MDDQGRNMTADWGERTGAALVDLAIAGFLLFVGLIGGAISVAAGGGKRAARLRVVRDDGRPMTFWPGMLREFVVKQLLGSPSPEACPGCCSVASSYENGG